MTKVKQK